MLSFTPTATGYASKDGRFRLTLTKTIANCKLYTVTSADNGQQVGAANLTLREAKKAAAKAAGVR